MYAGSMMLSTGVVPAMGTSPGAVEGGWHGKSSDSGCGLSQCLGAQNRAQVWKEDHYKTKEAFPTQMTQGHSYETYYTSNSLPGEWKH